MQKRKTHISHNFATYLGETARMSASSDITIPEVIFGASKDVMEAYIEALFNGVSIGRNIIVNSTQLSEDLSVILSFIGINSRIERRGVKYIITIIGLEDNTNSVPISKLELETITQLFPQNSQVTECINEMTPLASYSFT